MTQKLITVTLAFMAIFAISVGGGIAAADVSGTSDGTVIEHTLEPTETDEYDEQRTAAESFHEDDTEYEIEIRGEDGAFVDDVEDAEDDEYDAKRTAGDAVHTELNESSVEPREGGAFEFTIEE